ncbi:MAG: hypothetical protein ACRYG8_46325 [Janthinobacterium lividum]
MASVRVREVLATSKDPLAVLIEIATDPRGRVWLAGPRLTQPAVAPMAQMSDVQG